MAEIIDFVKYKKNKEFHKNTSQRIGKSDWAEMLRSEIKDKVLSGECSGNNIPANFMIFDDYVSPLNPEKKMKKELKNSGILLIIENKYERKNEH